MQQNSLRYHAYLVRFWIEGGESTWRASAQHVQSGETVRFADVAQLFAFLQARLLGATGTDEKQSTDCSDSADLNPPNPLLS